MLIHYPKYNVPELYNFSVTASASCQNVSVAFPSCVKLAQVHGVKMFQSYFQAVSSKHRYNYGVKMFQSCFGAV